MTQVDIQKYIKMLSDIATFQQQQNRLPNYEIIDGNKYMKADYLDAIKRVDAYTLNNQKMPIYVNMKPTVVAPKPAAVTRAETEMGRVINNAQDLYAGFEAKGVYNYYYNSKYTIDQAWTKFDNTGINCTDSVKIAKPVLVAMGYTVDYVSGEVKCADGQWYGHIWLRIKGKEYPNYVYFDVVAVTHQSVKRPLGSLCCIGGTRNLVINPKWIYEQGGT